MIDVTNPRTGTVDYRIEATSAADIAATATRLRAAQPRWCEGGADDRAAAMRRWADAIEAASETLVARLSVDTGRQAISRIEVSSVIAILRRWAGRASALIDSLATSRPSATPGITIITRHAPYPLVGVIAPWNFPLLLALIDAIPALAAGCAVLVKPSEVTPRFIPLLRETLAFVPELAEVIAIVEGDAGTGQAIVENVDYICFTGSVATGRKVAEAAAKAFLPANLELGGKDPMIVLGSADPVKAAGIALRASVNATGQACQSIERVYVDRTVSDIFLTSLVDEARTVTFNYPDIDHGDIGPFIFAAQAGKVQAQINEAVAKGARLLTGGTVETLGGGKYLRPTVLIDVTPDMAVIAEETFGPVIPVTLFDTIDEAIGLANDSNYGLSAAVIGDPDEAERVAERLEAGAISINDGALTTGVFDAQNASFKLSGMGPSRMGESGVLRFLRTKALIRQDGEAAPLAAYSERTG